jgi:hypothetical protein
VTVRAARSIALVLPLLVAVEILAQSVPAPMPPYVPVQPIEPGGLSVGCPRDWAHREAGPGYFSCRSSQTSAFCSGTSRASPLNTLEDVVAAARAELAARGFVVRADRREAALHYLVYDDPAGNRVALFLRAVRSGRRLDVTCGSEAGAFAALLPTFLDVARMAR